MRTTFPAQTHPGLAHPGPPPVPKVSGGERRLVKVEEAWILGLDHEDALARAAG